MRWLLGGVVMLWVAGVSAQAVDPVFGAFERPYKQALLASSLGEREQAVAAVAEAESRWWPAAGQAVAKYSPAAVEALAIEVAGRLAVARWQLAAGHSASAHETLEGVRLALASFREGRQVFVLNDKLTAFHEPMEHAVLTAMAAAATPGDELLATLRAGLPELRSRWAAALALVEGDPDQSRLAPALAKVTASIQKLAAALAANDAAAATAAGKGLKPAFRDIFLGVEAD